jgi:hypothetical protein
MVSASSLERIPFTAEQFNVFMIQSVHIGFLPVRDPASEQFPVFLIYAGYASHT